LTSAFARGKTSIAGSSPAMTMVVGLLTFLTLSPPVHADDIAPAPSAAQMMDDLMWNRGPIGGPFTLVDTDGKTRSDAEFRGKLLVLYFGYTACPDVCPTDLTAIAQAVDALGRDGDQVQPVFITLDPAHDTPKAIADYVAAFHPRLLGLTGTPDEIRKVATAYKAYFTVGTDPHDGRTTVDHTGVIYLVSRNGEYLGFMPPQTDATKIAEVLRKALAAR
jgi:cytochrome oxidase Cu insertion factor (SCO1/SenC/PrrC family)